MEVKVDVNENDIVHVSMGDTSVIEIDAYPDNKFKGVVTSLANSSSTSGTTTTAITSDQVTNFEVKIHILPESYQMLIPKNNPLFYPFRPGMSATVDIQTQVGRNILSVPIQSITTRIDSTKYKMMNQKPKTKDDKEIKQVDDFKEFAFKYDNGTVSMVEVKTGIQDNNYIQIISGLKENDEVISAPYSIISKKLKDKDRVKKVPPEKLFSGE